MTELDWRIGLLSLIAVTAFATPMLASSAPGEDVSYRDRVWNYNSTTIWNIPTRTTVLINESICLWNSTNTTPFWDCLTGGWNVSGGGGGVTPASAPNKSIQFNYNNAFAGDSNLTWDNSENKLVVVGNGSFGEVLVVNGSYGNTSFTGNDIKMTRPAPNYVLASNAIAGLGLGAGGVNGGLFLHYSTRANTLYLNKVGVSINKGGADVALDVVGDVNVSANVTSPLYCFPDLSCFNASNFTTGGSGEVHNGTFNETDGVWLYNSTPFMVNANITAINNSLYVQWSNASSSEFFNGTFNSTSGGYVYNDTDWNIAFNETKMNDTIDDRLEPLWLNASLQQAQIDALAFGEVYNGTFNETDNTWLYNATPFNVSLNITAVNDSLYVQWLNTSTGGFTETEGYYVYNDTPTQVKFNETLLNLTIDYKLVALYVNASLQQDAIILLIQNASDQSQNITDLFANASEQSVHAELKGNPHNATLIELNDSETHGYGSAGQCLTTNSTVDGWNWSNCGTGGGSYTADGVYVYLSGSTFSFNQSAENDTIDARLVGLWANASDQSQQILVLTLNASDQSQDLLDLWVNASDQSQGISDLWSNASLQSQQIADLLVVGMSLITSLSNNWLDHDNFLYVNGSRQLTANWVTAKNISLSDADGALSAGNVTARGVFCLNNDCYTALPTGSSGDSPWYNDSQMIAAKSFYGVNASWFNATDNVTTPKLLVGNGMLTVDSDSFQIDGGDAFINVGSFSPIIIASLNGDIELISSNGIVLSAVNNVSPAVDDSLDFGDANTPTRFRNGFFSQNVSAQNVSAYYYFDESGAFWNSSNFTNPALTFNPVTNSTYVIYPARTALTTFNASVFNASANVSAPIVYSNTIDGGALGLTLQADTVTHVKSGNTQLHVIDAGSGRLTSEVDGASYDQVNVTQTDVNLYGYDHDFNVHGDTNINLLHVDAGLDRIGVGTNVPATLLHLYSTTGDQAQLTIDETQSNSYDGVVLKRSGVEKWFLGTSGADSDIDFILRRDASTNDLTVDHDTGNVGLALGSSVSPLGRLDILPPYAGFSLIMGSDIDAQSRQDNHDKYFRVGAIHYDVDEEPVTVMTGYMTSANNNLRIGGGTALGNAATQIDFYTGATSTTTTGTSRMTIDSAGNVGIGTANPAVKLEVVGSGETIRLTGTAAGNSYYNFLKFVDSASAIRGYLGFLSSTNDDMYVYSSGNVQFWAGSTVSAKITSPIYSNSISGRDVYITSAGELGYYSSALRNKQNVEPIHDINWFNELNPVSFEFKPKNVKGVTLGEKHYGLIAEDVEKLNPQLVYYGENDTVDGVKYEELIPILIKKVQEQDALIKNLTARIEKLEAVNP